MGYRKQPFGYTMLTGEFVINPLEAKVVENIYTNYAHGTSYNALVQELSTQGIAYIEGKPWNKNMVARILEDARYIGEMDYPAIVSPELAKLVREMRQKKQRPPTKKTAAQKILRQMIVGKATKGIDRNIRDLLNGFINNPDRITSQSDPNSNRLYIVQLEQQLESMLESLPVDLEEYTKLAMKLTSEYYDAIGDSEYETERIKRIFKNAKPMIELDAEILRNTTVAVRIRADETICLELKNHQIIE